jgi:hypothetical protein
MEVLMIRRFASIAVACLFSALLPAAAFAQAKPAVSSSTPPPPAAPAKFVPQVKGEGTVDFVLLKGQVVKGEIHQTVRLKNTSKGSLGLLSVEQLWYSSKTKDIASSGIYRHRALLNPGEVIEFTIVSPNKPDLYSNRLMFKHANGIVKPTPVKKIE